MLVWALNRITLLWLDLASFYLLHVLIIHMADVTMYVLLSRLSWFVCTFCLHFLAMQMWTLARFLPWAVGYLIDTADEYWFNFLCLVEIADILFSKKIP